MYGQLSSSLNTALKILWGGGASFLCKGVSLLSLSHLSWSESSKISSSCWTDKILVYNSQHWHCSNVLSTALSAAWCAVPSFSVCIKAHLKTGTACMNVMLTEDMVSELTFLNCFITSKACYSTSLQHSLGGEGGREWHTVADSSARCGKSRHFFVLFILCYQP